MEATDDSATLSSAAAVSAPLVAPDNELESSSVLLPPPPKPPPKSPQPLNLDNFLKKHLKFTKGRVKYTKDDLMALLFRAQSVLRKEGKSILSEIDFLPINIVGDIHGQWRDLLRIFNVLGVPGSARYLFLGDYVDRGRRSVEVISLLLALKIKFRTKVYLLRGNHECAYINYYYGFFDDLKRRFDIEEAVDLWKEFNAVFSYLPLAGLIVGKVLCMHGGISPKLKSFDQLRKIPLPTKIGPDDGLTLDLLWSDPKSNEKDFAPNDARECSYFYGSNAVKKMCKKLNIDMVVRAHQAIGNGFGFFANQHMATIFSAPRYVQSFGRNSLAAILCINDKYEFTMVLLNPTTKASKGKFLEQFNVNSKMSISTDEITKIDKMPKDYETLAQISEMSEMGTTLSKNEEKPENSEEKSSIREKSGSKKEKKPMAKEAKKPAGSKGVGKSAGLKKSAVSKEVKKKGMALKKRK